MSTDVLFHSSPRVLVPPQAYGHAETTKSQEHVTKKETGSLDLRPVSFHHPKELCRIVQQFQVRRCAVLLQHTVRSYVTAPQYWSTARHETSLAGSMNSQLSSTPHSLNSCLSGFCSLCHVVPCTMTQLLKRLMKEESGDYVGIVSDSPKATKRGKQTQTPASAPPASAPDNKDAASPGSAEPAMRSAPPKRSSSKRGHQPVERHIVFNAQEG